MATPHSRSRAATGTEAHVWAEVLVRFGLLHAALLTPNGQWLVQEHPDGPVLVLNGPGDVVELAARIQLQLRTQEAGNR